MPGKFSDPLGEVLHQLTMDGPDEELGDVQDFGWYGLLANVTREELERVSEEIGAGLDFDEAGLDDGPFHFIVSEDNQGFFDYSSFDTEQEANNRWSEIQDEAEEFYLEGEESEKEDQPSPEDIAIEDKYRGYSVGEVEGKFIGEFLEWDDAVQAAKDWMEKNQFWPNVWHVSDHGNWSLLSSDDLE
jgi:hypothetical protein